MSKTRRGALILMASSSAALVTGTFGFSSAEIDREMNVDTAEDGKALLTLTEDGLKEDTVVLFDNDEPRDPPAVFDVKNAFKNTIHVRINIDELVITSVEDGVDFEEQAIEVDELDPGTAIKGITLDIPEDATPGDEVTGSIEIYVDESNGLRGHVMRNVSLVAEEAAKDLVRFTGEAGNVKIPVEEGVETVKLTYWGVDNGELSKQEVKITDIEGSEIQLQAEVGGNARFAAVYVTNYDRTYFHQNLELDDSGWMIDGGQGSNEETPRICDGYIDPAKNGDEC